MIGFGLALSKFFSILTLELDPFEHTSFVTPMMIHEMMGQPLEAIDLALKTSCHFY